MCLKCHSSAASLERLSNYYNLVNLPTVFQRPNSVADLAANVYEEQSSTQNSQEITFS